MALNTEGSHQESATPESTVRSYYTFVDAGDFTSLVNLFAPDAVYRRPGYAPLIGHDALNAFYRGERVIEEGRHEITELVASGAKVAVNGRFAGRLNTGKTVELRFADFFTLDDEGLFTVRDTFFFTPLV